MIELLPHQIPPPGNWLFWHLVTGDRGDGKTFAAASFVRSHLTGGKRAVVVAASERVIKEQIVPALLKIDSLSLAYSVVRRCLKTEAGDMIDLVTAAEAVEYKSLVGRRYDVGWIEDLGGTHAIRIIMDNVFQSLRGSPGQAVLTGNYAYPGSEATVIHRR